MENSKQLFIVGEENRKGWKKGTDYKVRQP